MQVVTKLILIWLKSQLHSIILQGVSLFHSTTLLSVKIRVIPLLKVIVFKPTAR